MNAVLTQNQSALFDNAPNESFWRSLNPDLHITPFPLSSASAFGTQPDASVVSQCAARMIKEGYFEAPSIMTKEKADRFSRVVIDLVNRNIAPVFAFVYDEFWQMATSLNPVLCSLLDDGYQMMPTDIWIWHVDKNAAARGWRPHRDMLVKDSVRDDNRPRVINVWMPLTDATPLNACMYVLPMNLDPNIPDKLEDASSKTYNATMFQNIRAVPAQAGSALGWNTHIMHWGGRSSEWAEQPRISVAIYFQSQDCNLNEIDYEPAREGFVSQNFDRRFEMPFASRLRAIAGAIRLYDQKVRIDFPDTWQDLFTFSDKYIQPY